MRSGPQTYDRRTLGALVGAHGLGAQRWLFPFPDYKLPSSVLAEEAFATLAPDDVAALARRLRSPHLRGALAFDLRDALVAATQAGLGADLANSFSSSRRPRPPGSTASSTPAPSPGCSATSAGRCGRGPGPCGRRRTGWSSWSRHRWRHAGSTGSPSTSCRSDRSSPAGPWPTWRWRRAAGRTARPSMTSSPAGSTRWMPASSSSSRRRRRYGGAGEHPFRPEPGRRLLPADRLDVELGNFVVGADGVRHLHRRRMGRGLAGRPGSGRPPGAVGAGARHRRARHRLPRCTDDTVDDLALDLAARAGLEADHDLLERFTHAETELQRLVVFAPDDEILARLDGSRTRRDRVVARTATGSRIHEALLDAWADAATARDERDRLARRRRCAPRRGRRRPPRDRAPHP